MTFVQGSKATYVKINEKNLLIWRFHAQILFKPKFILPQKLQIYISLILDSYQAFYTHTQKMWLKSNYVQICPLDSLES